MSEQQHRASPRRTTPARMNHAIVGATIQGNRHLAPCDESLAWSLRDPAVEAAYYFQAQGCVFAKGDDGLAVFEAETGRWLRTIPTHDWLVASFGDHVVTLGHWSVPVDGDRRDVSRTTLWNGTKKVWAETSRSRVCTVSEDDSVIFLHTPPSESIWLDPILLDLRDPRPIRLAGLESRDITYWYSTANGDRFWVGCRDGDVLCLELADTVAHVVDVVRTGRQDLSQFLPLGSSVLDGMVVAHYSREDGYSLHFVDSQSRPLAAPPVGDGFMLLYLSNFTAAGGTAGRKLIVVWGDDSSSSIKRTVAVEVWDLQTFDRRRFLCGNGQPVAMQNYVSPIVCADPEFFVVIANGHVLALDLVHDSHIAALALTPAEPGEVIDCVVAAKGAAVLYVRWKVRLPQSQPCDPEGWQYRLERVDLRSQAIVSMPCPFPERSGSMKVRDDGSTICFDGSSDTGGTNACLFRWTYGATLPVRVIGDARSQGPRATATDLSPDGERLIIYKPTGIIEWDLAVFREPRTFLHGYSFYTKDRRHGFSVEWEEPEDEERWRIVQHDLATGTPIREYSRTAGTFHIQRGYGKPLMQGMLAVDSLLLLRGHWGLPGEAISVEDGVSVGMIPSDATAAVEAPDGTYWSASSHYLRKHTRGDRRPLIVAKHQAGYIDCLSISRDGATLLAQTVAPLKNQHHLLVFDATTGEAGPTFSLPYLDRTGRRWTSGWALAEQARKLFVIEPDGILRAHDLVTGRARAIPTPGRPLAVSVSSDGSRIAVITHWLHVLDGEGRVLASLVMSGSDFLWQASPEGRKAPFIWTNNPTTFVHLAARGEALQPHEPAYRRWLEEQNSRGDIKRHIRDPAAYARLVQQAEHSAGMRMAQLQHDVVGRLLSGRSPDNA